MQIYKKLLYIIFFTLIIVLFFRNWFFSYGILFHGDFGFHFNSSLKEIITNNSWNTWIGNQNFGAPNILLQFLPYQFIYGIFAYLNIPYGITERVVHLWPAIILSFTSAFIFSNAYFKQKGSKIIGLIIFTFNSYFLVCLTGQINIAVSYAVAPLIFIFVRKIYLEQITLSNIIWLIFATEISIVYDTRLTYITFIVCFLYIINTILYQGLNLRKFLYISIVVILLLLINLFWIFSIIMNKSNNIASIAGRDLWGINYYDILSALTLDHPFWTGEEIIPFYKQPIPYYFFLLPVFAFSSYLFWKRNIVKKISNKEQDYLFWFSIGIIGIFLTKFVNQPFFSAYQWSYQHLPGFSLFREPSKFFLLTCLSYTFLTTYTYDSLKKVFNKNKLSHIILTILLVVVISSPYIYNCLPLLLNRYGSLFVTRNMSSDYLILEKYFSDDSNFFRSLWIPTTSPWSPYSNIKPIINSAGVAENELLNFTNTDTNYYSINDKSQARSVNFLLHNYSSALINAGSIKYVIIPTQESDKDNDFFIDYGGRNNPNIRQYYIDELKILKYLKQINIGTKKLVIYENSNYHPYIQSFTNLQIFDSLKNLSLKYQFATGDLKQSFAFFVQDTTRVNKIPATEIHTLFEDVSPLDIQSHNLKSVQPGQSNSQLYQDLGKRSLVASIQNNTLLFEQVLPPKVLLNGYPINLSSIPSIQIASLRLTSDRDYLIESGTTLYALNSKSKSTINLGEVTQPIHVLSVNPNNQVTNGSSQNGMWTKEVGDCNHYDPFGILGMWRTPIQGTDGKVSLQLEAVNHIACTNTKIPVKENTRYLFSFDYQSPNAKNAGYYLSFNDQNNTIVNEYLPILDLNWHNFIKQINVPRGASQAVLNIYSYSVDNKTKIVTSYRNVKLNELKVEQTVGVDYHRSYTNVPILNSSSTKNLNFSYQNSDYNLNNIIQNPSFEQGLWQKQVGDCNNYDEKPMIGMTRSTQFTSQGQFSLQLEAANHIACTGPDLIKVKENTNYLFNFDYQSPNGKSAGYYVNFNDPKNTVMQEMLPIQDKSWHTLNKIINAPPGATTVSITVYSYSNDDQTKIITRYDNFHLIELPDIQNQYYLVNKPKTQMNNPKEITFTIVNPTKKLVSIRGATTPFYLAMSESYHPQWQVQLNNTKIHGFFKSWIPWVTPDVIQDDYHFKLDGFLNGWYVDPTKICTKSQTACIKNTDGSYNMEFVIEFPPQRWFYLGLIISGITLLGCLGYLGFIGIRGIQRRRRGEHEIKLSTNHSQNIQAMEVEEIQEETPELKSHSNGNFIIKITSSSLHALRKVLHKPLPGIVAIAISFAFGWYFGLDSGLLWFLFLSFLVYRWDSRIPGVLAILSLITCPILLSLGLETEAEQMAVYVYFLLVITIALQIAEYVRDRKTNKNIIHAPQPIINTSPFTSQTYKNYQFLPNIIPARINSCKKKGIVVISLVIAFISFLAGCISFEGIYLMTQNKKNTAQTFSPTPTGTSPISKTPSFTPTITISKEPDLSAYTIRILNGSGIAGEAARLKATLTLEKFKVGTIGNADRSNYQNTQITANKSVNKEYINKLKEILDKTYRTNVESQFPKTASQEADVIITIGKAAAK